jgi:hypothetical protein
MMLRSKLDFVIRHFLFRAFSASTFIDLYPGRCPGLLHFAPLALLTEAP